MIITVTLNPALDHTIDVHKLQEGGLNRIIKSQIDPGGKGINVSKVLKHLNTESIAIGFKGGQAGHAFSQLLTDYALEYHFVNIENSIRTNIKVVDELTKITTEFNEAGPIVSQTEFLALEALLENTLEARDWVVLSGSIPRGLDDSVYPRLIEKVRSLGGYVFFDADGTHFKNGIPMMPHAIKPNKKELEQYVGHSLDSQDALIKAAQLFIKKGIHHVFVTLGSDGALYIGKNETYRMYPLEINAHSTVGAGDAFVAAAVLGLSKGYDLTTLLKLALATSAGAVITEGTKPMNVEWIKEAMQAVRIEAI